MVWPGSFLDESSSTDEGMSFQSMPHQYLLVLYFLGRRDRDNAGRIHLRCSCAVSRIDRRVGRVVLGKRRWGSGQRRQIDIFRTLHAFPGWLQCNCCGCDTFWLMYCCWEISSFWNCVWESTRLTVHESTHKAFQQLTLQFLAAPTYYTETKVHKRREQKKASSIQGTFTH